MPAPIASWPDAGDARGGNTLRSAILTVTALTVSLGQASHAQDAIKLGFVEPVTEQFSQLGKHLIAGVKYYMEERGARETWTIILRFHEDLRLIGGADASLAFGG